MELESTQFTSPINSSKNNHPLKKLFLLEVGIFEIGFVTLLLGTVFGLLVFFHIINIQRTFLANLFPTSKLATITQQDSITTTANAFLQKELIQQYIPLEKNYTQDSFDKNVYSLLWQENGFNGRFLIRVASSSSKINKFIVSTTIDKPNTLASLSAEVANRIVKTYFPLSNALAWNCDLPNESLPNSTLCFSAYRTDGNTVGYEIISPNDESNILIYLCSSPNFLESGTAYLCRRM